MVQNRTLGAPSMRSPAMPSRRAVWETSSLGGGPKTRFLDREGLGPVGAVHE